MAYILCEADFVQYPAVTLEGIQALFLPAVLTAPWGSSQEKEVFDLGIMGLREVAEKFLHLYLLLLLAEHSAPQKDQIFLVCLEKTFRKSSAFSIL